MSLGSAFICVVVPWGIFFATSNLLSFATRYNTPYFSATAVLCFLIAILAVGYSMNSRTRQYGGKAPAWCSFAIGTSVLAWILAVAAGEYVYTEYMHQFYDVMTLNDYSGVDPSTVSGNRLMDGARLTFVPEARVDTTKWVGFKNIDTYCVAPITVGNSTLDNYDFWAVGLNCCNGDPDQTGIASTAATAFHCGEYNSPNAHSGLRLMREDLRAYFRLAVQDAEATHGIKATHPMFYSWMENPTTEILSYQHAGARTWLTGVGAHFVLQLSLVIAALTFL